GFPHRANTATGPLCLIEQLLILVLPAGNDVTQHFLDFFDLTALLLLRRQKFLQLLAVAGGLASLAQPLITVGRLEILLQLPLRLHQLLPPLAYILGQLLHRAVLLLAQLPLLFTKILERPLAARSCLSGRLCLSRVLHLLCDLRQGILRSGRLASRRRAGLSGLPLLLILLVL